MSKRDAKLYLSDIVESVSKIEKYTNSFSYKKFSKDKMLIDAVIRNLTIIGEAAKNIPKEIKSKNSDIVWREIIGLRNKVTHEYFGVDEEILWQTIKEDLPYLKTKILKILKH